MRVCNIFNALCKMRSISKFFCLCMKLNFIVCYFVPDRLRNRFRLIYFKFSFEPDL